MSESASTPRTAVTFRPMAEADIAFGLHLCAAAGWNQTEADWRRLLALAPAGCFVAEIQREPVGTVVAVAFGPVAWVSMVLVEPDQRGRGIGTALMQHILEHLDSQPGITAVRLDATDLGAPIYRKLGFTDQFPLLRLQRPVEAAAAPLATKPPPDEARVRIKPADDGLPTLAALDRAATHTDRRVFLSQLLGEHPDAAWVAEHHGEPTGYLLSRPGTNAAQIGPGVAHDDATANALIDHALQTLGEAAAFIDVPAANTTLRDRLAALGFTEQRRFTRMTRGNPVHEHVPHLLASSGPEKG